MTGTATTKMPWIVIVGGFLGAGKTTLLLAAARELAQRKLRCALVLNDQGDALVDTKLATLHGLHHGEVTGGCFCCRLSQLIDVMAELRKFDPDVIFAEPVGSCTDISATILQPLRGLNQRFNLAPFTVLVDPERATALTEAGADPSLKFLFTTQLREADLICFSKSDLQIERPQVDEIDGHRIRQLSALTGDGVGAWLDEVMEGTFMVGEHILDIDYVEYAQAEAALAWLNLQVDIIPSSCCSPLSLLGPLFDTLDVELSAMGMEIVHMKAVMGTDCGYVKAAICGNGEMPHVEGNLDASPAALHRLLLNLRVVGGAEEVRLIVMDTLKAVDGRLENLQVRSFHPDAPQPERRYSERLVLSN